MRNENTASQPDGSKGRVDYKELLTERDFAVFCQLRDLRKETSLNEAIPVYAIFTNEQLAEMVKRKITSLADMKKINGISESKASKYGSKFIELLSSNCEPETVQ